MTAPSSILIDSGDTFIVTNEGDDPIDRAVYNRRFRIEPGKLALVPFDFIRIYWGDPRSRQGVFTPFCDSREKGWVNKRELEIVRLGVLYGSYAGDVATLLAEDWPRASPLGATGSPKRIPQSIQIRNQAGDEIVPPCFDRTGEMVYGTVKTDSTDLSDEVAYRSHLERQIDELKSRLDNLAPVGGSDVEVDGEGEAGASGLAPVR